MRIGVDVGGTKIEAAVMNNHGELVLRRRVATPAGDYAAAIEAIAGLVENLEQEIDRRCPLGFGIPGAISPATKVVKNAFNSPFNGHALDRDLETRLKRQVRMTNDANCFALSEAIDGAAAGAATVFGIILGTGCGGGIVLDGKALTGANRIGGEWGHNPLPWMGPTEQPGDRCKCGQTGCIETFLSGTGFATHHSAETGNILEAHEIAARAESGDRACQDSLARYENQLARALASVINLIDPEVIVLGGGMSNIHRLYANVPLLWSEWIFSDQVDTKIVSPKYGDSSGVRGAAWLWPDDDTS
jgi:fructokinase